MWIRALSVCAVVSVALAVLLVSDVRASTPPHPVEIGLHDEYYVQPGDPHRLLQIGKEMGAGWLRMQVLWSRVMPREQAEASVRPAQIAWDFTAIQEKIRTAAALGYRTQVVLGGPAPRWANRSGGIGVYDPDARQYADFVANAVKALRVVGVSRYSLWNEPNFRSFLQPLWMCGTTPAGADRGGCRMTAAKIYRRLYRAGYEVIHSHMPEAEIVMGETAPFYTPGRSIAPLKFLRALLCTDSKGRPLGRSVSGAGRCGRPLAMHAFATHPYDFRLGNGKRIPANRDEVPVMAMGRLGLYLQRAAHHGTVRFLSGRPRILATEFGYFTQGDREIPSHRRQPWLASGLEHLAREPFVEQIIQYQMRNVDWASWNTGVFDSSGRPFDTWWVWKAFAERVQAGHVTKRVARVITEPSRADEVAGPSAARVSAPRRLLVGDSLAVGMRPHLGIRDHSVQVGRGTEMGVRAIRAKAARGKLLYVSLGTNDLGRSAGWMSARIREVMRERPSCVVWGRVTARRPATGSINTAISRAARDYDNFVIAEGVRPGRDGLHPDARGYRALARNFDAAARRCPIPPVR